MVLKADRRGFVRAIRVEDAFDGRPDILWLATDAIASMVACVPALCLSSPARLLTRKSSFTTRARTAVAACLRDAVKLKGTTSTLHFQDSFNTIRGLLVERALMNGKAAKVDPSAYVSRQCRTSTHPLLAQALPLDMILKRWPRPVYGCKQNQRLSRRHARVPVHHPSTPNCLQLRHFRLVEDG